MPPPSPLAIQVQVANSMQVIVSQKKYELKTTQMLASLARRLIRKNDKIKLEPEIILL